LYIPHTFSAALFLIVISMLCWGSWANLSKAVPNWRLEYFYLDYMFAGVLTAVLLAASMGSSQGFGLDFVARLHEAGMREVTCAFLGGLVWSIGNILMVNAIAIAGLAVAFPITSALGIVLGVGIGYLAQPIGSPTWLVAAVIVLIFAAYTNAAAYRNLATSSGSSSKWRGIVVSLIAGVLVGIFPPLVGRAISGAHALDSYNVSLCFTIGALAASLIVLPILLSKPLVGNVASMTGYLAGKPSWHLVGAIAGAIWCIGTVSNFVSAGVVGVAISWGIGSGAPVIGALWGIFLWKEFKGGGRRAKALIALSMALYVVGVVTVAISYQLR
jgi:glucose uptake protein